MTERLRPEDLAFLVTRVREHADAQRDAGDLRARRLGLRLRPAAGADRRPDRVRAALPPAARARCRAGSANPVWVDDEDFDLTYHVRRSALPRPGSIDQLRDLTARIMSRRLDRHRPLWEMYFIEGRRGRPLRDPVQVPPDPRRRRRHHRPRPGASSTSTRSPRRPCRTTGTRSHAPSPPALVAGAVRDSVRDPRLARGHARRATPAAWCAPPVPSAAGSRRSRARWPTAGHARSRRSTARLSEQRRFVTVQDRRSRTTARSAGSTAAPSTTSSWPPSPARCATG